MKMYRSWRKTGMASAQVKEDGGQDPSGYENRTQSDTEQFGHSSGIGEGAFGYDAHFDPEWVSEALGPTTGFFQLTYEIQRELRAVFIFRYRMPEFREEGREARRRAAIDSLAHFHDHEGAGGVQSRSRLVQEQDDRVVDDVDSDGDAAAFPAGDAAVAFVADDEGARKPELGGKHESLFHSEHGEEKVILHDVSRNHFQKTGIQRLAVQRDGTFQALLGDSISEGVDQR
ncbi:hypothetical protein G2W53_024010 [Senna tora]|uniref:Uncharacterized protein n=1 Tax=Senna tora TaxID=362788 RepID=A0A834WCQ4_9FABA|nr:hypothetical protein G2W53_024010 [Senna tora]